MMAILHYLSAECYKSLISTDEASLKPKNPGEAKHHKQELQKIGRPVTKK
jgi:hypothetical protein